MTRRERDDGGRARLPELGDGRVRLRAFGPQDVPLVLEASADPMIPLITTVPQSADPRSARAYLARQARRLASGEGYSFAIADHDDRARGQIGLWPRRDDRGRAGIGYWPAPSARGRGFASAAVRLVADWAWTLGTIERLELFTEPSNAASIAVAESTGFSREGPPAVMDARRRDPARHARVLSSPRRTRCRADADQRTGHAPEVVNSGSPLRRRHDW
ncbi:GNAT family N-acetyltransferase [Agromyces sp. NPDC058104]|uniref:GNAT family N-acetyltransferase n=1 Tax=Agromyces sp. NPDC058104 TaxID=3346342 RepID=UPI0036D9CE66